MKRSVATIYLAFVREDKQHADSVENVIVQGLENEYDCNVLRYDKDPLFGEKEQAVRTRIRDSHAIIFIFSLNSARRSKEHGYDHYSLELNLAKQERLGKRNRKYIFGVQVGEFSRKDVEPDLSQTIDYCHTIDQLPQLVEAIRADLRQASEVEIPVQVIPPTMREYDPLVASITPHLEEIAKVLGATHLGLYFLGKRVSNLVELAEAGYQPSAADRYTKMQEYLAKTCFRERGLRDIAVFAVAGHGASVGKSMEHSSPWQLLTATAHTFSQSDLPKLKRDLVDLEIQRGDLWLNDSGCVRGEYRLQVIPIKYIMDKKNRDIAALLICCWNAGADQTPPEKRGIVGGLIESLLLPCLRDLRVAELRCDVKQAPNRQAINELTLDACLALSGADWGCIKSGRLRSGTDIGEVTAECVMHCPVYFNEGSNQEADDLLGKIIREGGDRCVPIGGAADPLSPHPAQGMYVALIRDGSDSGKPRLEPRISLDSPIVGAVVLEHVDEHFLVARKAEFAKWVAECANIFVGEMLTHAHDELLTTIESSRRCRAEANVVSLQDLVLEMLQRVFQEVPMPGWSLVEVTPMGDLRPILRGSKDHTDIESLAGVRDNEEERRDSPILYACNTRNRVVIYNINTVAGDIAVRRRDKHTLRTVAAFAEDYREQYKQTRGANKHPLILNLGRKDVLLDRERKAREQGMALRSSINLAVVPLVFTTGMPVGALVLSSPANILSDHRIEALETLLPDIASRMYLFAHDPETYRRLVRG